MGSLPAIPGFRLESLIAEEADSKLYAATIDSRGARHRLVGESPSGRFFSGESLVDGQACVVRVFDRESVTAESFAEFIEIRRAAAACRGAGCCEFIGSDTNGRWPFVAMMEVPGQTLESLYKEGQLGVAEVCEIASLVCARLAALHEGGLVHGALMPSTIRVRRVRGGALEVSLSRVGADVLRAPDDGSTVVYSDDPSVDYSAPELLIGSVDSPTPACDLYALGVIIFEAIAGAGPFRGSQAERVNQRLHGAALRLKTRASVPDAIDKLVSSLLSRDPRGRPSSARLLGRTLSSVAAHEREVDDDDDDDDEATVAFVSPPVRDNMSSGTEDPGQPVVLGHSSEDREQHTVVLGGETMAPESGVTVLPEAFLRGAPEFLDSTTILPGKNADDTASGDDSSATICPMPGVRPAMPRGNTARTKPAPDRIVLPQWLRGWSSQKKLLVINIGCLVIVVIGLVIIASSR